TYTCTRRQPTYHSVPYTTHFRSWLKAIVRQKANHGLSRGALVAIIKQMVRRQRMQQRRRFVHQRWIGRLSERTQHGPGRCRPQRSEEHTSELQSRENLVCRLLLG